MKFAPDGAMAAIHANLGAFGAKLIAMMNEPNEPLLAAEMVQPFAELAAKIESVDLFVMAAGEDATAQPMPLVVVHGQVTPKDVAGLMRLLDIDPNASAVDMGQGRYTVSGQLPFLMIYGGEASELPQGVCAFGMAPMMTRTFLGGLGKKPNAQLNGLLQRIDSSAQVWFAVDMSPVASTQDAPRSIMGSIWVTENGPSALAIDFKDANWASAFVASVQGDKAKGMFAMISSLVEYKQEGTRVAVAPRISGPVGTMVIPAVLRARAMAKRAASMSNLKCIASAIAMYQNDYQDRFPPDLPTLQKDEHQSAAVFISPGSNRPAPDTSKVLSAAEMDYVYLYYPKQPDNASAYILVYERPELNAGEGTNVLYCDLHVGCLKHDEFEKQLKKAQDYLKSLAK